MPNGKVWIHRIHSDEKIYFKIGVAMVATKTMWFRWLRLVFNLCCCKLSKERKMVKIVLKNLWSHRKVFIPFIKFIYQIQCAVWAIIFVRFVVFPQFFSFSHRLDLSHATGTIKELFFNCSINNTCSSGSSPKTLR